MANDVEAPARTGASAAVRKKRGRETAGDMLRSLGIVLVLVVAMWFFAQPPDSDQQPLRVVDPSADVAAFTADAPGAPVPRELPSSWRPTSSTLGSGSLRIGYVSPDDTYAEYAASTAPAAEAVADLVGAKATRLAPRALDGVSWEQYRDADGSLSLVRSYGEVVVVLGTQRATADLADLEVLAGSLAAG